MLPSKLLRSQWSQFYFSLAGTTSSGDPIHRTERPTVETAPYLEDGFLTLPAESLPFQSVLTSYVSCNLYTFGEACIDIDIEYEHKQVMNTICCTVPAYYLCMRPHKGCLALALQYLDSPQPMHRTPADLLHFLLHFHFHHQG